MSIGQGFTAGMGCLLLVAAVLLFPLLAVGVTHYSTEYPVAFTLALLGFVAAVIGGVRYIVGARDKDGDE